MWPALSNDFVLHIRRLEEPITRRTGSERVAAIFYKAFSSCFCIGLHRTRVCFVSCYFRALQIVVVLDSEVIRLL